MNVVLGFVFCLNVPYFSAVKYLYQALPFFALLVGSLVAVIPFGSVGKGLFNSKRRFFLLGIISLALLVAALASTVYYTNGASLRDYLQYRVEPNIDYGYALLNPAPLTSDSPLMSLQLLGFTTVFCGLLYADGQKLGWTLKLQGILKS